MAKTPEFWIPSNGKEERREERLLFGYLPKSLEM
jgi:hypothetical protein